MTVEAGTGAGPEAPAVGEDGGDAGDITPPAANEWWQFSDKDSAEAWANDLVSKRIARHKKNNVDPLVQERDTLKAQVDELLPLKQATQTDSERWESERTSMSAELQELRDFKASTTRANQIREIADEMGLPASFIPRISGGDDDEIREDIQSVLDALSEGGFSNTGKKTPPSKNPKAESQGGGSVSSGGGSDSEEPDDDSLSKSIIDAVNERRRNGGMSASRR